MWGRSQFGVGEGMTGRQLVKIITDSRKFWVQERKRYWDQLEGTIEWRKNFQTYWEDEHAVYADDKNQ